MHCMVANAINSILNQRLTFSAGRCCPTRGKGIIDVSRAYERPIFGIIAKPIDKFCSNLLLLALVLVEARIFTNDCGNNQVRIRTMEKCRNMDVEDFVVPFAVLCVQQQACSLERRIFAGKNIGCSFLSTRCIRCTK